MKARTRIILIMLTIAAVLVPAAIVLRPRPEGLYRVTILPSLGGGMTGATSINEHGQVAGFGRTREGVFRFFLWDRENGMQHLGPGLHGTFYLNDAGQIAGMAVDPNG
ncbi:MAG: hypothetical protein FJ280_14855 [Planctomycetes bacterium]|nr:hypothetical protein [Planctomycetota bacterium]